MVILIAFFINVSMPNKVIRRCIQFPSSQTSPFWFTEDLEVFLIVFSSDDHSGEDRSFLSGVLDTKNAYFSFSVSRQICLPRLALLFLLDTSARPWIHKQLNDRLDRCANLRLSWASTLHSFSCLSNSTLSFPLSIAFFISKYIVSTCAYFHFLYRSFFYFLLLKRTTTSKEYHSFLFFFFVLLSSLCIIFALFCFH